jgi:hypothetical protein
MSENHFLNICLMLVIAFSCTSCMRIYDAITLKPLINKVRTPFENPVVITIKNDLPCFSLPSARPKEYIGIDGTDAKIDFISATVTYTKKKAAAVRVVWSAFYDPPSNLRPKAIDLQPLSNLDKCILYGKDDDQLKTTPNVPFPPTYSGSPIPEPVAYLSAFLLNTTYYVEIKRVLRDEKGEWDLFNESPFCIGLDKNNQRVLNPPNCDQPL